MIASIIGPGSKATTYFIGTTVLVVAAAVWATSSEIGDITSWIEHVLGGTFVTLLAILVFLSLFCWIKLQSPATRGEAVWFETGLHAANGIATLGLTYTLLGIGLGIGSLAEQELNPETIPSVISGLTRHFSLAFMTSVIGLPAASVLRALLMITQANTLRGKPS